MNKRKPARMSGLASTPALAHLLRNNMDARLTMPPDLDMWIFEAFRGDKYVPKDPKEKLKELLANYEYL